MRPYVGVTAVPPNEDPSVQGTEAAYRADGRLAWTADGYGNKVSHAYDLLGRAIAVTREASGMSKSAQTASRRYDTVGRVVEELDDNWSPGQSASRLVSYDAAGRVTRVQLAPQLFGTSWVRAELRYEYKSLGRRTRAYALEPKWVSGALTFSTREIAGYGYDRPYAGSAAYAFTAGKLSSLTSPLTTIALGYDQYGSATRRDQWFSGLSGAFSVAGDVTPDGRLRWSSFVSGFSQTVNYTGSYDSAGRPAKIDLGATALWEAVPQAGNTGGAYDALDRIHHVRSNIDPVNGAVNTVRVYSSSTGQLTAHGVTSTTAGQVFQLETLDYTGTGTKLKSYRDALTATTYEHTYDWNGRLTRASAATASTSPLAQSYDQDYSFTDPSWPPRATVGNLESVTDTAGTVDYDYLADRAVSRSVRTPWALLEVMVYDHQGRLTSRRTGGTETEGFAYDVEDHLKQVRRSGTVAEVLEYDPLGAIMFRKVGTKAYWYVGPLATVTADVSTSCQGYGCSPVTTPKVGVHVLLGGSRIATVRAPPSGSPADPAGDVLYYHRDLRGSVIATTLTGGRVGVKYRYGPYGELDRQEVVDPDPTADSELGFTGGLRLGWTPGNQSGSLLLLEARVYHAELRHWLQADTVDILRYTYAAGDPVNSIDPSGRMSVYIDGMYVGDNGMSPEQALRTYGSGYTWKAGYWEEWVKSVSICPGTDNPSCGAAPDNAGSTWVWHPAQFSIVPPPEPLGVNVDRNIRTARLLRGSAQALWDPLGAWARRSYTLWRLVRTGGPWDYKNSAGSMCLEPACTSTYGDPTQTAGGYFRPYRDFGNFNFGATGRALGFPGQILMRGAGLYQVMSGTREPGFGVPWGLPSYGDDPRDQYWIRRGIEYYDTYYGD